jgi:hypothetical protein
VAGSVLNVIAVVISIDSSHDGFGLLSRRAR